MEFVEYRLLLGSHIQSIRKARGLTQEQVAERIGIDCVSIGYIEQGKRTPKVSTLYALSQCYDVEMQELFDFERPHQSASVAQSRDGISSVSQCE